MGFTRLRVINTSQYSEQCYLDFTEQNLMGVMQIGDVRCTLDSLRKGALCRKTHT